LRSPRFNRCHELRDDRVKAERLEAESMSKGFKFTLGLMVAIGLGFWLFLRYFIPNCDRIISEPQNSANGKFFAYTDRWQCRGGKTSSAQLLLGQNNSNEKGVLIAVPDSGDDIDFEWQDDKLIVKLPKDAKFEQFKVYQQPDVTVVRD
jgi:hypothetical protein